MFFEISVQCIKGFKVDYIERSTDIPEEIHILNIYCSFLHYFVQFTFSNSTQSLNIILIPFVLYTTRFTIEHIQFGVSIQFGSQETMEV